LTNGCSLPGAVLAAAEWHQQDSLAADFGETDEWASETQTFGDLLGRLKTLPPVARVMLEPASGECGPHNLLATTARFLESRVAARADAIRMLFGPFLRAVVPALVCALVLFWFTGIFTYESELSIMASPLYKDVAELTQYPHRAINSTGHDSARAHIIERMGSAGLVPYEETGYALPYGNGSSSFQNLAGMLPGRNPALPVLLLGAHYDTVPTTRGADDNAVAVAILLDVAERLSSKDLERSVLFVFFDAEEPPYFQSPVMGSVQFFENQCHDPLLGAVILDLVAHRVPIPMLEDLLFCTGMESARFWRDPVREAVDGTAQPLLPTLNRYVGDLSDHYVFRMNNIPYLFLSSGWWSAYHKPEDTIENVDFQKAQRVADLVTILVNNLAGQSAPLDTAPWDTTEEELRYLRDTLGPVQHALPFLPEDRDGIDRLAKFLADSLGRF